MEDNSKDQFVDELLEASLRRYRSEEPRAGLEGRILAQVLSSEHATRRRTWAWAIGVATAVILLVVVSFVFRRQPASIPSPEPLTATKPASPLVAPPAVSVPLKPRGHTVRSSAATVRRATTQPSRPAQFPTPAPLSEEERLLLVYAAQSPNAETENLTTNDLGIEPLEIPDIMIAKIEIKKIPKLTERD